MSAGCMRPSHSAVEAVAMRAAIWRLISSRRSKASLAGKPAIDGNAMTASNLSSGVMAIASQPSLVGYTP